MVKIGGRETRKLSKKCKFSGNRGKCMNFAEIGGEIYRFCGNREGYAIYIIGLVGMDSWTPLKEANRRVAPFGQQKPSSSGDRCIFVKQQQLQFLASVINDNSSVVDQSFEYCTQIHTRLIRSVLNSK